MRVGSQARLFLAGLVLMWLASIAREPGGLPAFAGGLDLAISDLGAMARDAESAIAAGEGDRVVAFPDGIVCERDPETGSVRLDECVAPPSDLSE